MSFLTTILKKKDEPIKSYNDFWTWFQKNEKTFFKVIEKHDNIERDFFDKISPKLNELKEGFFYLTGMLDDQTVELILTADGTIKNIVFVEELVASARQIPGWKFTASKPALNIENVQIDMHGFVFDKDTLSFYSKEHSDYPDEIDIVVVHKYFKEQDKSNIANGVYIFLDNFLGELEFATTIDNLTIIGESEAEKELIPIEKLKAFLVWRQKEFLEKYEGERHDTENDAYATYETELKDSGRKVVAVINTTLLDWDGKASHPWFMTIKINYKGDENNGMPDDQTYKAMYEFESEIMNELRDSDGYLNVGRESGDNLREIYFACKDFRRPSKVLHQWTTKYANRLDVSYDIYKDKYWQKMDRYR
jgi:hypothetical protein